ncbi:MAG: hypothetical protein ACLFSH_11980 [Phormidium sp.]
MSSTSQGNQATSIRQDLRDRLAEFHTAYLDRSSLVNGDTLTSILKDDILESIHNEDHLLQDVWGDWLDGESGDDGVDYEIEPQVFLGKSGNDVLIGSQRHETLFGGKGRDLIDAKAGNNLIYSGQGNDIILGGEGNDTMSADMGDDEIYGGGGNDIIAGREGQDLIYGESGNNLLFGNTGDDTLVAGQESSTLFGGQDNDRLLGGEGNDVLYGDLGIDTLSGGGGKNIFVLDFRSTASDITQSDVALDFNPDHDRLGLTGNLTYEDLDISQGTGDAAADTLIRVRETGFFLMRLQGVNADSLNSSHFTSNLTSLSNDSTGDDSTGDDSTGDDSTGDDSTGDDSTGDDSALDLSSFNAIIGDIFNNELIGGNGQDLIFGVSGEDQITGSEETDVFVLSPDGLATITDFTLDEDRIGLSGSLSFADLEIGQEGDTAVIRLNGTPIAILENVNAEDVTAEQFITVDSSLLTTSTSLNPLTLTGEPQLLTIPSDLLAAITPLQDLQTAISNASSLQDVLTLVDQLSTDVSNLLESQINNVTDAQQQFTDLTSSDLFQSLTDSLNGVINEVTDLVNAEIDEVNTLLTSVNGITDLTGILDPLKQSLNDIANSLTEFNTSLSSNLGDEINGMTALTDDLTNLSTADLQTVAGLLQQVTESINGLGDSLEGIPTTLETALGDDLNSLSGSLTGPVTTLLGGLLGTVEDLTNSLEQLPTTLETSLTDDVTTLDSFLGEVTTLPNLTEVIGSLDSEINVLFSNANGVVGTNEDELIYAGLSHPDLGSVNLTGSGGQDVFLLGSNSREAVITDFNPDEDLIGIADVIDFADLEISQVDGSTTIRLDGQDYLSLDTVLLSDLNADLFVQVDLSDLGLDTSLSLI